jgi:hypothetical protein
MISLASAPCEGIAGHMRAVKMAVPAGPLAVNRAPEILAYAVSLLLP